MIARMRRHGIQHRRAQESLFFFLARPRPPPRSTLSPYSTLFRSNAPRNPWKNALVALAGPAVGGLAAAACWGVGEYTDSEDRKSTRLNSSHVSISYAVFCLKKKKEQDNAAPGRQPGPRTRPPRRS